MKEQMSSTPGTKVERRRGDKTQSIREKPKRGGGTLRRWMEVACALKRAKGGGNKRSGEAFREWCRD